MYVYFLHIWDITLDSSKQFLHILSKICLNYFTYFLSFLYNFLWLSFKLFNVSTLNINILFYNTLVCAFFTKNSQVPMTWFLWVIFKNILINEFWTTTSLFQMIYTVSRIYTSNCTFKYLKENIFFKSIALKQRMSTVL